ncbi:UNVERIFIED_CONTAM: hypothetical protein FKN15_035812 [Acipenser sinensis]
MWVGHAPSLFDKRNMCTAEKRHLYARPTLGLCDRIGPHASKGPYLLPFVLNLDACSHRNTVKVLYVD